MSQIKFWRTCQNCYAMRMLPDLYVLCCPIWRVDPRTRCPTILSLRTHESWQDQKDKGLMVGCNSLSCCCVNFIIGGSTAARFIPTLEIWGSIIGKVMLDTSTRLPHFFHKVNRHYWKLYYTQFSPIYLRVDSVHESETSYIVSLLIWPIV
jgi:hypothetical protein